ncbi:hypothetical protein AVEN_123912-1 [Araneus ventricosus]|uniref:Uncharacterized protein n=1 Tax=Araneus ventricosus TaxID=182803 RepID=A0A4Y2U937_ARAVE|nr:hypothetical protein AVEN_123912-1 [Araneus ventricosus]
MPKLRTPSKRMQEKEFLLCILRIRTSYELVQQQSPMLRQLLGRERQKKSWLQGGPPGRRHMLSSVPERGTEVQTYCSVQLVTPISSSNRPKLYLTPSSHHRNQANGLHS